MLNKIAIGFKSLIIPSSEIDQQRKKNLGDLRRVVVFYQFSNKSCSKNEVNLGYLTCEYVCKSNTKFMRIMKIFLSYHKFI